MNERLQELYLVASEQFKIVQDQGLPAPYQTRAFAEKFAELIVRECMMLVEGFEITQEVALDEYVDYEASAVLKEHFGVEE